MTDVSNLDNLAAAIASSSTKIKAYAKAQAAATQTQESQKPLDPRDFGAKFDGVTDDTAAIQATLDASPLTGYMGFTNTNDLPARQVVFPPGRAKVTDALKVHANMVISGAGEASTYIVNTNPQAKTFELATGREVQITLRDFGIIPVGKGIEFNQTPGASILGDTCHRFENMQVVGGTCALRFTGGTELRVLNFKAYRQTPKNGEACVALGGTDHMIERVTVAQPIYDNSGYGGSALILNTSNSRVVNCKVFGGNAPVGGQRSMGPAIFMSGQRNTVVACEVQDYGGGWAIVDGLGPNQWIGCVVDSCAWGVGIRKGVVMDNMIVLNRGGTPYQMAYAFDLPDGEDCEVTARVGVPALGPGQTGAGNRVKINGAYL